MQILIYFKSICIFLFFFKFGETKIKPFSTLELETSAMMNVKTKDNNKISYL